MGVMFDIIGSILVRTAIVLIVLRMNVSLNSMVVESVAHATIQQSLSVLREVMSADFDAAGLNVTPGTSSFLVAKPNQMEFYGDLDGDGTPETIYYYVGPQSELSNTVNPNDRKLYRQINGGTSLNVANGITTCAFTYYDQNGLVTTSPSLVKMFTVKMTMQDGAPVDSLYPSTYWEQSFFPPNL